MRYDSYKDSEVQWIGEVPHHWVISKLKYVSDIVTGNTPPTKDKNNYEGGEFLWVKPNEINGFIPTNDTNEKLTEKGKSLSRVVPPYSVLVNGIGDIGEFGLSEKSVSTNQQIHSIVFNEKVDKRFGLFHTSMMKQGFLSNSEKVVVSILNKTKLENLKFVLPPLNEQKQIVSFLDTKTSIIDSLIQITQRKIELLKEQRTSLINKVVTKGLDPNVEMKNSDIEWIGEIPKHWEVKKLKYLFGLFGGKSVKSVQEDNGKYPIFGTGGEIIDRSKDYLYNKRTLLLGRKGTIDRPFLVDEPFWVSDVIYYTVQKTNMTPDYLLYLFNTFPFDFYVYGSTQPSMSKIDYENHFFPVPPIEEQQKIEQYLDEKNKNFKEAILKEEKRIELLKEYKQSLISEVVTGKKRVV
tara:strand:- start:203 stop:1423 length:1221 start_codon:yes stop_codon:yes gene_type:complete